MGKERIERKGWGAESCSGDVGEGGGDEAVRDRNQRKKRRWDDKILLVKVRAEREREARRKGDGAEVSCGWEERRGQR